MTEEVHGTLTYYSQFHTPADLSSEKFLVYHLNRWARETDYVFEKSLPLPGIELKFPDFQAGGLDNLLTELNVSCCKPHKFKYLYQ
jgi:hypothetical protein